MSRITIDLPNGYRAYWEGDGTRLAVYGPVTLGYRNLEMWCEIVDYVPAWGTRADTVTEWRAYRFDYAHRETLLGSRSIDDFDSPDGIAEWLASLTY